MPPTAQATKQRAREFSHEALLYAGERDFLDGTVPFIRDGLAAGEAVLVLVSPRKIELMRDRLGGDAERVHFTDMDAAGINPARLIPAWSDFVGEHGRKGAALRGIGEPIWPGRSDQELAECHRHEALLNIAFADVSDFRLLCPYDVEALAPETVQTARTTHPTLVCCGSEHSSGSYRGLDSIAAPFDDPLPAPPGRTAELRFEGRDLGPVREWVTAQTRAAGITGVRADDLLLAVNEIAANSVCHGGGAGALRAWREDDRLVCEVSDSGRIERPLAGRERPQGGQLGGYGLWLANQLCDLVQVRTFATGTVVRMHMRAG